MSAFHARSVLTEGPHSSWKSPHVCLLRSSVKSTFYYWRNKTFFKNKTNMILISMQYTEGGILELLECLLLHGQRELISQTWVSEVPPMWMRYHALAPRPVVNAAPALELPALLPKPPRDNWSFSGSIISSRIGARKRNFHRRISSMNQEERLLSIPPRMSVRKRYSPWEARKWK